MSCLILSDVRIGRLIERSAWCVKKPMNAELQRPILHGEERSINAPALWPNNPDAIERY
jgi:hypothetical protein